MEEKYKVLIVVDAQNGFIQGSLANQQAAEAVPNMVKVIENIGGNARCLKVLVTQDTHNSDYLKTREGRWLPIEHCIEDTWDWDIHPDVYGALKKTDAAYFTKETFGCKSLIQYMEDELGINGAGTEIHVIGLCTDICVVSNVLMLRAAFPESDIFVHADACAGSTPEKHKAALAVMESCMVIVVEETDIC